MGKLIIFSAPSGSGKSTIINYLLEEHPELNLAFSISATSRAPRGQEQDGVEYFFLSPEEFRQRIDNDEFLEYEEVYPGRFYGTLKAQVERQSEEGQNVLFDVDVKGGMNIKKYYGDRALSLFIQPPSIEELRRRLEKRGTETQEVINDRIARAKFELDYAPLFDEVVINDDLDTAKAETLQIVSDFLKSKEKSSKKNNMDFNGSKLSTKVVRILFGVNVFAMLCFIFMAIFFFYYGINDLAIMLVVVACLSALNNWKLWGRIKQELK